MDDKILIDPNTPSKTEEELTREFRKYIVGQDFAIKTIVRKIMGINAAGGRLRNKRRPAGIMLFLGPTGVGKTKLVQSFAKIFLDSVDAMLKLDCSELSQPHEISRLIGAPPGYLGHDQEPLLTQDKLDYWGHVKMSKDPRYQELLGDLKKSEQSLVKLKRAIHNLERRDNLNGGSMDRRNLVGMREYQDLADALTKEVKKIESIQRKFAREFDMGPGNVISVVLFDEIEKAHRNLFHLLYQIMSDAKLTLHWNPNSGHHHGEPDIDFSPEVYFHNTFVFLTSNIAEKDIENIISGGSAIGFSRSKKKNKTIRDQIYKGALREAKKFFPTAFLGRIGKENIIVFSQLTREELSEYLNRIIIPDFINNLTKTISIEINFSPEVIGYILDESCDPSNGIFGARALEGVFKKRIEENIYKMMTRSDKDGIVTGDKVYVEVVTNNEKLKEIKFYKSSVVGDSADKRPVDSKIGPEETDEFSNRTLKPFKFGK